MIKFKSVASLEDIQYNVVSSLGIGAYGAVLKVKRQADNYDFAMKVMVAHNKYERQSLRETVSEEIKNIQTLQNHHHFISIYDAFETNKDFAIVTHPVASDGNLEQFIQSFQETTDPSLKHDMGKVLRKAFGCLASGLAFMKEKRIRHKDIKPRNILVDKGRVLYCDFGLSHDSSGERDSTTTGRALTTAKYRAPEVKPHIPRNSSSDTFSLGCVSIDILSALCDEDLGDSIHSLWRCLGCVSDLQREVLSYIKDSLLHTY